MKILQFFFKRLRKLNNYKIYWHRWVPFVIAEVRNVEYENLKRLGITEQFPMLLTMWNENGNFYILEGLDYFLFGKQWYTKKEHSRVFGDSMRMNCEGLTDSEKMKLLIDDAIYDIDLWLDGPEKKKENTKWPKV